MSADTGVKSANYSKEYLFLRAHIIIIFVPKAVFSINKLPNIGSIITGKGFHVFKYIKVLSLVIGYIFNMPHPL
jgi:hypothetical protein